MTVITHAKLKRGPNGEKDPNDYARSGNFEALDEAIADAEPVNDPAPKRQAGKPPTREEMAATEEELAAAKLSPRCIVENHTYADVAQLIAPGGTGKTTIIIYEAICIALGRPVWGCRVLNPGWTLFVTSEDRREQLLARKREILATIQLTPSERAVVLRSVLFWDVTGEQLKLIQSEDGNIRLTELAADIVDAYKADPPSVVIFDPLVSFGASEAMVNDNEQGLITAARRIVRGLDCCVRFIHHTGKANARAATLDQYSGRGGSALPDGSRMTSVLQSWTPEDQGTRRPPIGCAVEPGSSLTILARPKLSYSPPNLPDIWIKRTGFAFEHFVAFEVSGEERRRARADQIERYLVSGLAQDRYYTKRALEDLLDDIGMSKAHLRAAVAELVLSGRVDPEADLPAHLKQGSRKTYLHPNCAKQPEPAGAVPKNEPSNCADADAETTTAPP